MKSSEIMDKEKTFEFVIVKKSQFYPWNKKKIR